MYVDYLFYKNSYFGNVISEEDFPKFEDMASDKIYYITMGKVDRFLVENENGKLVLDDSKISIKIKKSVCKLAEIMFDISQAEKSYRKSVNNSINTGVESGGSVASITSGSESITYFNTTTSKSSISAIVNADTKTQEQYFFDSIRVYLGDTGLLSQAL